MFRAASILILIPSLSFASQLTANLAYVNRVGPIVDDSVGAIQTVTTDLSTTPSTNTVTLEGVRNGLRVWTGDQDHTLPWFDLYTTTNGVAGPTVRLYYGQGRILWLPTGTTIALGTTNGRTVKVSQMTVPGALPGVGTVTNAITVAKAGPPIWTPGHAQVTLPSGNSAFTVVATNSFPLFVSEYDGANWSPPRWYRLESNCNVSVLATYPQVALGSYNGDGLTVITPAGGTVLSTGATMHLTFPAITGTTRHCTNSADLMLAITNAVSGDEIVLQDGVYGLTTNIVNACFAANGGMDGITLRSFSGVRDNVVITGNGTNTGAWSLTSTNTNATATAWFKDVTFGLSNGWRSCLFTGGRWGAENVRWTGVASQTVASIGVASFASSGVHWLGLWCQADTSAEDCYDGTANVAHTSDSVVRLVGCSGSNAGPAVSDQVLTTHTGMPMEVWGGNFNDAQLSVAAADAVTTPFRLYFANIFTNAGRKGGIVSADMFGISQPTDTRSLVSWSLFSDFGPGASTAFQILSNSFLGHCWSVGCARQMSFGANVGPALLAGNVITDASIDGIRCGFDATGQTNAVQLIGNTWKKHATALNLVATNIYLALTNNACQSNTTSLTLAVNQRNNFGEDYNRFDPTVSANIVPSANTTTNADAAVDVRFFPVASGNCDGTGTAVFPWVGDSDPWGYVWVYKSGVWPIGARSRAVVQSGSGVFIYPDVW